MGRECGRLNFEPLTGIRGEAGELRFWATKINSRCRFLFARLKGSMGVRASFDGLFGSGFCIARVNSMNT